MTLLIDFDADSFDLSANAAAPLAPWARELQQRGHYAEFGAGPEAFDCLGLVCAVQRLIGRAAPDYAALYRGLDVTDLDAIDQLMRTENSAWRAAAGAPGDVLVLGLGHRAHHVAVLCGAGRALQARRAKGITIDEIEGRRRVTRFCGMRLYGVVAPA